MIYIGTNHFMSVQAAVRYYACQGIGKSEVNQKISDGSIAIGMPTLKSGQRLKLNRQEGRYIIEES